MDRQTLDSHYVGSRGSPARLFRRAATQGPLDADTYAFFLEHVDELDIDIVVAILGPRPADGVERPERPFLRRLAQLTPGADASRLLQILRLAREITPAAASRPS